MSTRIIGVLGAVLACTLAWQPTITRAAEEPLPSGESIKEQFARRMEAGQREKRVFEERYRYSHTRVREERSTKGKLRQRSEEEHVHDPREKASPPSEKTEGGRYGERDIVIDSEVLSRFTFEVEGRERLQGRNTLKVTFRPASGDLPKRSTLDRFINRTAGVLWLEESTLTLLKVQMGLLEKVNFLGGLAGIVHQLDMTFERASTAEGVWYTRRGAWTVDYRVFLKRKVVQFEEGREQVECVKPEVAVAESAP